MARPISIRSLTDGGVRSIQNESPTTSARERFANGVAVGLRIEPHHAAGRLHCALVVHFNGPRQIGFPGPVDLRAGLEFAIEAQQVKSHVPQVEVDVARFILRERKDGFDISKIELTVADRVHEAELLSEVEEANIGPELQRNFLRLAAALPEFAEARAVAEHLAVGVEVTNDARRLEQGEDDAAEKEHLRERVVVLWQDRVAVLGAE